MVRLCFGLAAMLLTGFTAGPVSAEEGQIRLNIGGTAGTPFTADCKLKKDGGAEAFAFKEIVPFRASYSGTGLSCEIIAPGAIEVELVKGGSRSSSSVSRGSVNVNIGS
jgi:hypothetical protein